MEHGQAVGPGDRLFIGLGCSSGVGVLELVALVDATLDGRSAGVMAVPAMRAELGSVREAADLLGLRVVAVSDAAIEAVQGRCLTRPCRAVMAVAEGAALAVAGEAAVLLGPRRKAARATCALAAVP